MPRKVGSQLPITVRTAAEVAAVAPELTRRQLEYWVEMGWVHAVEPPSRGHPRTFSVREKRILAAMYRLVVAGFPARNAAWIARAAVMSAEKGKPGAEPEVELGGGIYLTVMDV